MCCVGKIESELKMCVLSGCVWCMHRSDAVVVSTDSTLIFNVSVFARTHILAKRYTESSRLIHSFVCYLL